MRLVADELNWSRESEALFALYDSLLRTRASMVLRSVDRPVLFLVHSSDSELDAAWRHALFELCCRAGVRSSIVRADRAACGGEETRVHCPRNGVR